MNTEFDVVIVGGGLVGMSLALALSHSALRVLAVEAQPPAAPQAPRWDERHFALGRASALALDALGVACARDGHHPIRRIHVSRRGAFGRALLNAGDYGLPAFGQIVPARQLVQALEDAMARADRLARWRPATLRDIRHDADALVLDIADGDAIRTCRTRLLVAADGTESAIRQRFGIPVQRHDYGQTALVTAIETERPLDGTAYERFTDTGPMALLPLDGQRAGLVMTLPDAQASVVSEADDARFLAFAQDRFGTRLGRWRRVGRRQPWPLRLMVADAVVADRVVLVGNAAQTIHPIGAQGFNLGLRDATTLAETLIAARGDVGEPAVLARYADARRDDRTRTMRFSDALARFMASDLSMGPLRSLALLAADQCAPIRDRLVYAAMGFR